MKRMLWTGLCLGAALMVSAMVPQAGWAASVDVNGVVLNEGIAVTKGTTMMSEEALADAMFLEVKKDKKAFTLTNDDKTVTIEGTIGEKTLRVNGEQLSLPVAATTKNGQLWLPMRPLMETFGRVDWDSANKRVRASFDYTRFNKLSQAKEATQAIRYEIPVNSGVSDNADGSEIVVDVQGGVILEEHKDGYIMSVNRGSQPIIKPVHVGYKLHTVSAQRKAYAYDSAAYYWQEAPIGTSSADDRRYIYVQPLKDGAKPVCLDEWVESANADVSLSDIVYQDGKLLWTVVDEKNHQMLVKLYDVELAKTRILDEIPLAQKAENGISFSHVTVGDDYAAVTVEMPGALRVMTPQVYCYDLKSGERKSIGRGYNLHTPEIYGDTLVMIAQSGEAPSSSSSLWCYDLKHDKWLYEVSGQLLGFPEGKYQMNWPIRLDDSHLAVSVYGSGDGYALTILDVEKGTLAVAEDKDGKTLCFSGGDAGEENLLENEFVVFNLSPCKDGNVSNLITARYYDGVTSGVVYPVNFDW